MTILIDFFVLLQSFIVVALLLFVYNMYAGVCANTSISFSVSCFTTLLQNEENLVFFFV